MDRGVSSGYFFLVCCGGDPVPMRVCLIWMPCAYPFRNVYICPKRFACGFMVGAFRFSLTGSRARLHITQRISHKQIMKNDVSISDVSAVQQREGVEPCAMRKYYDCISSGGKQIVTFSTMMLLPDA